jgi:hypothetical protein
MSQLLRAWTFAAAQPAGGWVREINLLDCPQAEINVRALTATLCGLAFLRAGTACAATATTTTTSADTQFANYAFASELGSGIYDVSGRTIQVYQLAPYYRLREAAPQGGRPGIRLIFPLTVGFFNFEPADLVHFDLPTSIGALSLEPGVELDWWMNDDWDLYPYVKAGGTFASSAEVNAVIYGVGVRSDYRFELHDLPALYRAELIYAGVHYHGDLPNDSFTRLRNGVQLRRNLPLIWHDRAIQLGPYAFTDVYFNAPSGPASGISSRTLQFEVGLMLGLEPRFEIHGVPLPRLGIGYLDAGVLSGWRLVFGEPF